MIFYLRNRFVLPSLVLVEGYKYKKTFSYILTSYNVNGLSETLTISLNHIRYDYVIENLSDNNSRSLMMAFTVFHEHDARNKS